MRLAHHVPNAVTAARGLCGPVVAWLLLMHEANLAAFWVFIIAISTDLVDGWLARKLNAQTDAGLLLDPLADKVLMASSWISLLAMGWAPWWMVLPLLVRDAVILSGFGVAWSRNIRFEPLFLGRLMTSYEGVAVPLLLLHHRWMGVHWASAGVILGIITLALSLASALQYALLGVRALRDRHGI